MGTTTKLPEMMACEKCAEAVDRLVEVDVHVVLSIYAEHHPGASDDDVAEAAYACMDEVIAEREGKK